MDIWHTILQSAWFFVPAYLANMTPVLVGKIRCLAFLGKPLDLGMRLRGKPLLGSHKTFRGLITGVIAAIALAYIQRLLVSIPFFASVSIIDYRSTSMVLWGFLLGFGALFGDMAESLVKRQAGIKPGNMFFPFDQLDYTVFGLLFAAILFVPPLEIVITLLVLNLFLHILSNIISYLLGLKDVWY